MPEASPFLNASLSFVAHSDVHAAVAALGANFTLRVLTTKHAAGQDHMDVNPSCSVGHDSIEKHSV